jgi:hypothetical protein
MADERNQDPQMDAAGLYREEMITDRKVGAIRQLTPVTADGAPDTTRPVMFVGQAEIMTNMGPAPLSFEIEGKTLADAVGVFRRRNGCDRAHRAAIQELRRQQGRSRGRAPGRHAESRPGGPGGRGAARSRFLRAQFPSRHLEGCLRDGSPPGAGAAAFLHHQQIAVLRADRRSSVRLFITRC